jgi:hypothetical protein
MPRVCRQSELSRRGHSAQRMRRRGGDGRASDGEKTAHRESRDQQVRSGLGADVSWSVGTSQYYSYCCSWHAVLLQPLRSAGRRFRTPFLSFRSSCAIHTVLGGTTKASLNSPARPRAKVGRSNEERLNVERMLSSSLSRSFGGRGRRRFRWSSSDRTRSGLRWRGKLAIAALGGCVG